MQVIRSEVLGFCSGVRRAVAAAVRALSDAEASCTGKKVYSLGPLIHNSVALARLEERGLKILSENEISSLDESCVVLIRAHGVSPALLNRIKKSGASVQDATCPRVALSQKRAAIAAEAGKTVILCGDAGHAEVKAIEGSAGEKFILVQNAPDAERLFEGGISGSALLLSQTTFSPDEFAKIADIAQRACIKGHGTLEIFDSICPATQNQQKALASLAESVDAILVVGGKKSANSRRLFERARKMKEAYFVETAADLPDDFGGNKIIGITAGSSTPDFVIDDVESAVKKL